MSQISGHSDVLVVGGGLIGSALALGLDQQGWQVTLVEQASVDALREPLGQAGSVTDFEPRVSAISVASQRLLQQLGAWPGVLDQRHCTYTAMDVWDGDGTGEIRFSAREMQVDALGTLVENRVLVKSLFDQLAHSSVRIMEQTAVTGWWEKETERGITLQGGQRLSATLVVAADGGQSRLRQWAGLPTREWDYNQQAIVCTVKTTRSHEATAWQRFSPTGPLAFLPLSSGDAGDPGHYCSIVWSQDTDEARRLMALDDEDFRRALETAIEQRIFSLQDVSRRQAFALRQRHAKTYVRPGLALLGDAAHTIHPLAGQGANLGYGDVKALLDELEAARARGLAADDELMLARYQRRRKADNLAMMAAMEGFKRLFARDELALRWLRNTGMRWLDREGLVKNQLAARAMGL